MLKLFLIAIVLLGLLYMWWINTPTHLKQEKSPLVIAHRGSSGLAPENTLAAIQKSIDSGVDMIEVDLHLSKEGEVIILHDATLERTTNGSGEARDFTMEELQQLDAGSWFSEAFTGEKIPILSEVFELVQGKIVLLLELKKGEKGLYEGIEKAVVDQVRAYGLEKQVVLQSFESEVVDELVRIAPDMEVHKLYVGRLPGIPIYNDEAYKRGDVLHYPGVAAINSYYKLLHRRTVHQAHKIGKKVYVYTVNEEADMNKMIDYGVDGIITNYPDRLIEILRNQ